MVYTYTPAYYSSLHDTITSLCKTVLPFSLKKRRLAGLTAEQKLAKQQSENLKWHQESFHRILNLIGLCKEGILAESEVSAYRSHLLDTLIASPAEPEPPAIIRDKLLFLQELLLAKCISTEDYHASKRPLLQRLAIMGATVDCRDVIFAGPAGPQASEEVWSEIELKDEQCRSEKDTTPLKNKGKYRSPMKQIKGAVSFIGIATPPTTSGKGKEMKGAMNAAIRPLSTVDLNRQSSATNMFEPFKENPFWEKTHEVNGRRNESILMCESSPPTSTKAENEKGTTKVKKKAFCSLFQKEQSEEPNGDLALDADDKVTKSAKKQWSFDGFKKWKKGSSEDESTIPYLSPGERSDHVTKKKIQSDGPASDFFVNKVFVESIKETRTELCTSNPSLSSHSSWCDDKYGDAMTDLDFKDHLSDMKSLGNSAKERQSNSAGWVAFEDDNENSNPNLFYGGNHLPPKRRSPFTFTAQKGRFHSGNTSRPSANNPFYDSCNENQNAFWSPHL